MVSTLALRNNVLPERHSFYCVELSFQNIDRFLVGITLGSPTLKSSQRGGFNVKARGWLNLEHVNKIIRFLFVFKRLRIKWKFTQQIWLFICGTNWLLCGTIWLFCGTIWLLIGTIWLRTIWPCNEMTGYLQNVASYSTNMFRPRRS